MAYEQIWLIGFSGTGKSRIVRPLAAALDWEAVDIDKAIAVQEAASVPAIFAARGEEAFRSLETKAIAAIAERTNIVVATGGGAVLAEANREAMRQRGFVVCLEARPETILRRLQQSDASASERPLLQGPEPLARIIALKAERQPLYTQADFIIQTDELTPDQCTHQILLAYREKTAVSAGGPI